MIFKIRLASLLLLVVAGSTTAALAQRRYGGDGITVFTERNYRGQSATFREDVSNLRDSGMNDRIFSLRVAPGEAWEVCQDKDYRGRCVVMSGDDPDLGRTSWALAISSMRRVEGASPQSPDRRPDRWDRPDRSDRSDRRRGDSSIVLFDRTNYRGTPVNFDGPVPGLGSFNNRVASVTIGRGAWELCEGPTFSGRCITLDQSVPDLRAYGMRNRVTSVRPVRRGTPQFEPPPPPEPSQGNDWYIVLFEQTNYLGLPTQYNRPVPDLGPLSRRLASVNITKGVWELCEGPGFSGRCITLDRSVPDLSAYGLRGRVSSVRPAPPQPR